MQVKKGFTLVELSLSLAFIAVLSLTIALIISNAVSAYRRGMTLKQINTIGMDLVDDMRSTIQNSSTASVKNDCEVIYGVKPEAAKKCKESGAKNFVSLTKEAKVVEGTNTLLNVPVYGAFCAGSYSYIWNSGYFFSENNNYKVQDVNPAEFRIKVNAGAEENEICKKESSGNILSCKNFKLLKIRDNLRSVCVAMTGSGYNDSVSNVFDVTTTSGVADELPIDLLATDEANGGLAIYNLFVSGPVESMAKNALFYSVSFILGTVQGGANIMKSGGFCSTPDGYMDANFDYCAINKFNFAAEATGV